MVLNNLYICYFLRQICWRAFARVGFGGGSGPGLQNGGCYSAADKTIIFKDKY